MSDEHAAVELAVGGGLRSADRRRRLWNKMVTTLARLVVPNLALIVEHLEASCIVGRAA